MKKILILTFVSLFALIGCNRAHDSQVHDIQKQESGQSMDRQEEVDRSSISTGQQQESTSRSMGNGDNSSTNQESH